MKQIGLLSVHRYLLGLVIQTGVMSASFVFFLTITLYSTAVYAQLPPTAGAGQDQSVVEGTTVVLDGSGSTDPNPALIDATFQRGNLPGGTALEVELSQLNENGQLAGTASIGEGGAIANTALAYVLDLSGSANFSGGCAGDQNNDGRSNRIIDCEIAAALALHDEVISSETVSQIGLVTFSSGARVRDLDPTSSSAFLISPTADADGNGVLDIEQTLRGLRAGGSTNFRAAVSAACNLLAGAQASNRLVVFISDGRATRGGAAINVLPCDPPAQFEGFAIGTNNSCTSGAAGSRLQEIADITGGSCTNVTDTSNLPDILPEIIGSQITHATLTIDTNPPVDISDSFSPPLPESGPSSLAFSIDLPELEDGIHDVCVRIYGSDVLGEGFVETCSRLRVGDAPLTYRWEVLEQNGPPIILSSTSDPMPSFQVADDATYLFGLTVTNGFGLSATDTVSVSVGNATPVLQLEPGEGFAGGVTLISGSFTDQGYIDTHDAQIDWGDGTVDDIPVTAQGSGWGGFFGSHIYSEPGLYDITIVLTDDDGGVVEQSIDQFLVSEPVALWANSQTANRTVNWTGAEGEIDGRVHANNEIRVTGQTKTLLGQVTYAGNLSADTEKHLFSSEPTSAAVQPYPLHFEIDDFRPGGEVEQIVGSDYFDKTSECSNGTWHETQIVLDPGVYYANCDVQLNGSLIGGRVTIVSEGTIQISGSRPAFEPYHDGLLFLSGSAENKSIDIAAANSRFLGVLFSEFGEIEVSGSDNRFFCGILGDRVNLTGGGLELRGANCGRPDSTVAGPLLVPALSLSLEATPAEVLPGQPVNYSLALSHEGATLVVPSLIGLENVDDSSVSVTAYAYELEYYSLIDQAWIPFASAAASVDGYVPDVPLPDLGGMSLTLRSNPNANVTYPMTSDQVLGTTIAPTGFATWGSEAIVSLDSALLNTLLDPQLVSGIRNRVRLDTDPSGLQVRRLFTRGTDFIEPLRALGAEVSDAEITLTQPQGDPIVYLDSQDLDQIVSGEIVTRTHSFTPPVIEPRSGGESDGAYLARLLNVDYLSLYASASARAQSGVGLLVVPLQLAFATERVPVVELTSDGPALVFPGAHLDYEYSTQNIGSVDALDLTFENRLGSEDLAVTPTLPTALVSGEIANTQSEYDLLPETPAGSLRNLATLSWSDAAGNRYGQAEAEIVTTIAQPPALKVTLRDFLQLDGDGNGLISPGDRIGYEAIVENTGDLPVNQIQFGLTLDSNATLVDGSLVASLGTIVSGGTAGDTFLQVDIDDIEAQSAVSILFATDILDMLPDGIVSIGLQASTTAADLDSTLSDDPDVFGVADITVTRIAIPNPVLTALLSVSLSRDNDGNGAASAGDELSYVLDIANGGTAGADNLTIEVPVPAATQLVAGSLSTTVGTIQSGSSSSDSMVTVLVPSAAPNREDRLEFSITINNPVDPPTDAITARAQLSADNATTVFSDDPNTAEEDDATAIPVITLLGPGSGGGSGGGGLGAGGQGSADANNGIPGAAVSEVEPSDGTVVSGPSVITAQLTPPDGEEVTGWTVYVRALGSTELIELGSGSGSTVSVEFDPTLYANGLYGIVIESETSNGGVVRTESYVSVEGESKPGRVQFTLVDLDIQLGELPVSIRRSYDSFNRQSEDFGYAWTLDVADFAIQTNGFLGDGGWRQEVAGGALFVSYLDYVSDKQHFVVVTWPDGKVERFDLRPAQSVSLFPFITTAEFEPRDGATSTLEALDNSLFFNNDGNLYGGLFGSDGLYNPQRFRLTDRKGNEYIIDKNGGLISAQDPNGNVLTITNDGLFHSLGVQVQFERDSQNRITRIVDNEGGSLEYTYDDIGNLITVVDYASDVTNYEYDLTHIHHLSRITDGDNQDIGGFEYDENGRVIGITDALGATVTTSYDPDNLSVEVVNRRGFTTTEYFGADGNLARVEYPDGSSTEFLYEDPNNPYLVTSETNENGLVTRTAYTAAGDVKEVTFPDGQKSIVAYDSSGRPTSLTDSLGNITQFAYDENGNLIRYVDAEGNEITSAYDAQGRIISQTGFNGETTLYEYSTTYPFPNRIVHPDGTSRDVAFDLSNRPTFVNDENGNIFRMAYTQEGDLLFVEAQNGVRMDYEYADGNLIRVTTSAGGDVRFIYDAADQLIKRINDLGHEAVFTYDENGNRTSVTDESGNTTQFVYDSRDRLVEEIRPDGTKNTYQYDPAGLLVEETDANGRRKQYGYDAVDNVTQETWIDSIGNTIRTIESSYDSEGNLLAINDGETGWEFEYDRVGRVTRSTDTHTPGGPWVLDYQYGSDGGIQSVSDHTGVTVNSTYNNKQLPSTMEWGGTAIDPVALTFNYNPRGEVVGVQRLRGGLQGSPAVDSTYSWNGYSQVEEISHANSNGQQLLDFVYQYNSLAQLQNESGSIGERSYAYDASGQLTSAQTISGSLINEDYSYDEAGNRVDATTQLGLGNLLLGNADEVFDYDAVGNLVLRTSRSTGDYTEYAYDHVNQMVSADQYRADGQLTKSVEYFYDAYGRMVRRVFDADGVGPIAPETSYRTYSHVDLWADVSSTGQTETRYLFASRVDRPMARYRSDTGTVFYLTDRIGSVRGVVDDDGQVINQIDYSSFGVPTETNALDDDRIKYTAREFESEFGVYDYRSRHYDPTLGRFLSPDTVGFDSGDLNLYRYVFNAPHDFIDPFGTTAAIDTAITNSYNAGKAAAIACARNALNTIFTEVATEFIIYAIMQPGGKIAYVGRTTRTTELRFAEHLKTSRFSSGIGEKIGEFVVRIPRLKDDRQHRALMSVIEQEVMEAFGGKTKLLNERNAISEKRYKKYRKIFCGKK